MHLESRPSNSSVSYGDRMTGDVRHTILVAAASQRGLISKAQVKAKHDEAAVERTLEDLEQVGDLVPVIGDIWFHLAAEPAPTPTLEARALWMLTDPAVSVLARRDAFLAGGVTAVIGGLPALERWGLGPELLDAVIDSPSASTGLLPACDLVSVRWERTTAREDVDWAYGHFPHRSVEATLVDGLRGGLGVDLVAEFLRDALREHLPLDPTRLLRHVIEYGAEEGWSRPTAADSFAELVALAGGWPDLRPVESTIIWAAAREHVRQLRT
ncbi:hypothetical protein FB462_0195 [Curtobacterium citreum]|nr:hypothetical protein FB462_0195 [Curtobacterium citreum]